jgi:serine/threonine-protein kinase RsbW
MLVYNKIRTVPSNKNIISFFEDLFIEFKDTLNLRNDLYFNLMVAVTEGINNASGHGNKFDPNKNVTVELAANSSLIFCKIKDEGNGFNPKEVADPRDPENLLKDNGRGVFLMRELAKEFKVSNTENGTLVELTFEY